MSLSISGRFLVIFAEFMMKRTSRRLFFHEMVVDPSQIVFRAVATRDHCRSPARTDIDKRREIYSRRILHNGDTNARPGALLAALASNTPRPQRKRRHQEEEKKKKGEGPGFG